MILCAALAIAVIARFAFDVPLAGLLALGITSAITATLTVLSPTLMELGRRQPRLSLTVDEVSDDGDRLVAPGLRPWPFDAERIIANELAVARESSAVGARAGAAYRQLMDPFATQPTEKQHAAARSHFEEELEQYVVELRAWLAKYAEAARARSECFEVTLRLANAAGAAHAKAVTVMLDLPPGVTVIEEEITMPVPPRRPEYAPPQPRRWAGLDAGLFDTQRYSPSLLSGYAGIDLSRLSVPRPPAWDELEAGRRLRTTGGDLHPSRSEVVGEWLLMRAEGVGDHEVRWQAYTESARQPTGGMITLVVPASDESRPAFGRLYGVRSYPDVPLLDEDDEEKHAARASDPPLQPAPVVTEDSLARRLREQMAQREWVGLGLDPADDGSEGEVGVFEDDEEATA